RKSGKIAVIATPGSGKTFTLAHLAAQLISKLSTKEILNGTEVLVVTFSNSAVYGLRKRIRHILQHDYDLLPDVGYRIRTLHGLAHDIVRERPALTGLSDDFYILDEQASRQIIRELTHAALRSRREDFEAYLSAGVRENPKRFRDVYDRQIPDLAAQLCERFIKHCKDYSIIPGDFYAMPELSRHPLIRFATQVYDEYQRRLKFQGAVDFDDLILHALLVLEQNTDFLKRLHKQWPHVLEDEAQDSSLLQERLLRLLSQNRNWVRVGDPNQAINTTFTTAHPRYLQSFAHETGTSTIRLSQSGRSGRPIADLANALMKWTIQMHPAAELRGTFEAYLIQPAPPGDLQPNPSISETMIHIHYQPGKQVTPDEELRLVASSLQRWLPENPDQTVAVLVPENRHGYRLLEVLKRLNIPNEELLQTTASVRFITYMLETILVYLAEPVNPAHLSRVYTDVWCKRMNITDEDRRDAPDASETHRIGAAIARCSMIEAFLWPVADAAWMDALKLADLSGVLVDDLQNFRLHVQRWLQAAYLPADQLILVIAHELFSSPSDLALSYRIALSIRSAQQAVGTNSLDFVIGELKAIRENQRRFIRIEDVIEGYSPRTGVVTVATMHAAKGLEWDRVYLLSVNSYSFPSAQADDIYIGEKWFVRDQLNLEAELLAQAVALQQSLDYTEGEATWQARLDYAAERLRLLYVAITRARKELIILWNIGHYGHQGGSLAARPALPLIALSEYVNGTLSFA
ncbi:MAG: ATP-dependent helicase, partial [Chloroflexi bacterium]|nr:ATP-dependent helicase [Chloroflexota bacterium]